MYGFQYSRLTDFNRSQSGMYIPYNVIIFASLVNDSPLEFCSPGQQRLRGIMKFMEINGI